MGRFVAFGEIMLRLSPPRRELLLQTPKLDVWIAGAEANVATALARLGHASALVSAVPDGSLGDAAITFLRGHGVQVRDISRTPGRMGLYWVQTGAGLRATEVIYDRADSAFSCMPAEGWDWDELLAGADRLHLSGITPALGPNAAAAALAAAAAAGRLGVPVSFDGNYRAKLWQGWSGAPRETLRALVDQADILFGNHRDIGMLLDRPLSGESAEQRRAAAEAAFAAFPRLRIIASTARRSEHVEHHYLSARIESRDDAFETGTLSMPGVVDRIGTGDAFAAGVLHGLLRGEPPERMAHLGLALAALKHSIPGDAALFGARDLDAFLDGGLDVRR